MYVSGRRRSSGTAAKRRCSPKPSLRRLRRKGDRDNEATADAAARGPTDKRGAAE